MGRRSSAVQLLLSIRAEDCMHRTRAGAALIAVVGEHIQGRRSQTQGEVVASERPIGVL